MIAVFKSFFVGLFNAPPLILLVLVAVPLVILFNFIRVKLRGE